MGPALLVTFNGLVYGTVRKAIEPGFNDLTLQDCSRYATQRAILTRLARLQITGHLGDAEPVGNGITEMRVHIGPGYRLYCKQTAKTIILLLCGGDKDSQVRDIRRAKEIANCA